MAWEKLGTASVGGSIANTSWKEVGRTTLGSTSQNITCSFTPKDNMMFIYGRTDSTNATSNGKFRFGYNSVDSGSNYSERYAPYNSDTTQTSQDGFSQWDTGGLCRLDIMYMANVANQEKLAEGNNVILSTTGAGTAPYGVEYVGKWANTSYQANRIYWENSYSSGSDGLAAGTELIALGFDNDEADSGTNFWQELASVDTTGDNHTTGTFTAKKYLMVETCVIASGGECSQRLTFNDDTGSNYAARYSFDGGTDALQTSGSNINSGLNDNIPSGKIAKNTMFILNVANKEKVAISNGVVSGGGASAAPERDELAFKWTNTSNQITKIDFDNNKAGDWGSGSYIKVYGAD